MPYDVPPITFYRKALLELFVTLRTIKEDPHANAALVHFVQQTLIQKIVYIEKKIRRLKSTVSELKKRRVATRDSMTQSARKVRVKDQLRHTHARIDRYQDLLTIFRQIGDSLAFLFIDKYDLKPMAVKPAPGAISGKAGTRLERRVLRWAGANNVILLMNDLTHCLRYGDVTALAPDGTFQLIELKSGRRGSSREAKQLDSTNAILKYLREDVSDNLYGRYHMHRVAPIAKEVDYSHLVCQVCSSLTENELRVVIVEDGLAYIVWSGQVDFTDAKKQLVGWLPVTYVFSPFNWPPGHTPLPLSIADEHFLLRIYEGTAGVFTVTDIKAISRHARNAGFRVVPPLSREDGMFLRLEPVNELSVDKRPIEVGADFWRRLSTEFLGLQWMINAVIDVHTSTLLEARSGSITSSSLPHRRQ